MRRLVLIFCGFLPAGLWADIKLTRIDLGPASMLSFNAAWAQSTGTDLRWGFGLAAKTDIKIGREDFSLLTNVTTNQLLMQQIDGAKNDAICSGEYFDSLYKLRGSCLMVQVRLSPLYWLGSLGLGVSLTYNYFSNFTYDNSEVYNTKRSTQSLGPTAAFKQTWDKFTLMAAVHFDYAILTQAPSAVTKPSSLQAGVTIYAMFAIF